MYAWDQNQIPIYQLGSDFYDPVTAAHFPKIKLRYWNDSIDFNFPKEHLAHFSPLEQNIQTPLALRYHGHQFQHYNPDLGDGRGFLFAQLKKKSQWYDLGTKGSGQTPYSRAGDGKLTLKGALREALATEQLESLGVKTSKTLSFFETHEQLERHDEPSPTRSAVLTRFSLGHIRIGTFQRLAYLGQTENIKKLVSYCLFFYYPDIKTSSDLNNAELLLNAVVTAIAKLAAQVMLSGFVHGVLNTDNINISGELFDYGPYRFLPNYNPEFIAAYFDRQGLYCYGRQPHSFAWALQQLGLSLKLAYPDLDIEKNLEPFSKIFTENIQLIFCKRLNIKPKSEKEVSLLISHFFQMLQKNNINFENAFFDFHSKHALNDNKKLSVYEKTGYDFISNLNDYEIANVELEKNKYFNESAPCTLLIDEIEAIWQPIAENDDWNLFTKKIQQIRSFRGIYL